MRRKHNRTSARSPEDIAQAAALLDKAKVPTGPGHRLKLARQAKHMTLEQVSKTLRLNKDCITAIERDDYSDGTSFTFIRGYLRSYAKLTDLPPDEIVQAFDHLALTDERPSSAVVYDDGQLPDWPNRFIILGGVSASMVLLFVWWAVQYSPAFLMSKPQPIPMTLDAAVSQNNQLGQPLAHDSSQTTTRPTSIRMKFKDDCWVEVNDSQGKQIFAGLKSKGQRIALKGQAPFSVLLGNPAVVSLSLNNKPYNKATFFERNNARIVVG